MKEACLLESGSQTVLLARSNSADFDVQPRGWLRELLMVAQNRAAEQNQRTMGGAGDRSSCV